MNIQSSAFFLVVNENHKSSMDKIGLEFSFPVRKKARKALHFLGSQKVI